MYYELAILANQLKVFKRGKRRSCQIMNLQLSISNEVRPPQGLLDKGREKSVLTLKSQVTLRRRFERLKWDLEKEKKQKQVQGCSKDNERAFPLLLINTLRETKVTIKGELLRPLHILELLHLFLTTPH